MAALEQELSEVRERMADLARLQDRARRLEAAIRSLKMLWSDDSVGISIPDFPVDPVTGRLISSQLSAPLSVQTSLPISAPVSGRITNVRLFTSGPGSFSQAAEAVLREARKPLHVKTIISEMQRRGWYTDKSPEEVRTSLVPTLNRKSVAGKTFFKQPDKPLYGLLSWADENSAVP